MKTVWRGAAARCIALLVVAVLAGHAPGAAAKRATAARSVPRSASAPEALPPGTVPPAVATILRASGLALKSFALEVRSVEAPAPAPLVSLHAEQAFLLASTTKLVTSLAALDLLGPEHRWPTRAWATAPVLGGRLAGDLVIGGGSVGLTSNELRRWFAQMRSEGLEQIAGNIVLEDVALLHERDPRQARTTEAESAPDAPLTGREYNRGKLLVSVKPGTGAKAVVTLTPRPANVLVVNDVFMGGGCAAWARWKNPAEIESGPPLQLWVRGRWERDCAAEDVAWVAPLPDVRLAPELGAAPALPIAAPLMVAQLWRAAGGTLRGSVVEHEGGSPPRAPPWSSTLSTPVAEVLREMNKTSNNEAAQSVLLALAPGKPGRGTATLKAAQQRMREWLKAQGLAEGDITVELGSGQSRAERGRPRALVDLLCAAWRGPSSQVLVDSLPIAGLDGTLAHRMTASPAAGKAFLKTGTLSDTRALAGYVRANSGKVYAVSLIVTDAEAARGTPALDAIVGWIASAG